MLLSEEEFHCEGPALLFQQLCLLGHIIKPEGVDCLRLSLYHVEPVDEKQPTIGAFEDLEIDRPVVWYRYDCMRTGLTLNYFG